MRSVGILVSSDTCYNGTAVDTSGKAIAEIVSSLGYEVSEIVVLPDEQELLEKQLRKFIKDNISLVLTTGGTGFSNRDVMPEATKSVIKKEALGIAEAIRMNSLSITPKAMLSRATAGIADNTLIINLPGSEKAVRECLGFIMPTIEHGLDILLGSKTNCGRN